MVLLDVPQYGEQFYQLLLAHLKRRLTNTNTAAGLAKPNEKRELKKGAVVSDNDGETSEGLLLEDFLGFQGNASKFCVFAAIRSAIFEAETKFAIPWSGKRSSAHSAQSWYTCCLVCVATCKLGEVVNCRCHTRNRKLTKILDSDDSEESDDTTQRELVQKVPQIVGAGLRSMFELIAESKHEHPEICTKALHALLDVIQGQQPESFKCEPSDLIDVMYDLLLDLATYSGGTESYSWSAVACSALIGLCVARGDTGKMLKALAAMLMSPQSSFSQTIQLPVVLTTLQRSVIAVALNRPSKPDIIHNGIPVNSEIGSFTVDHLGRIATNLQPAIASNGQYLFLLIGRALFKIGSGFGGTLKGHVYHVNEDFGKDTSGWLGYANNTLYYRRISKRNFENVDVVDVDTLKITSRTQFILPSAKEICNVIFSDGEALNIICTKDETLLVKQLQTSKCASFDLPLKLARKTFQTLGYAQFEAEVLNQSQIQKIVTTCNPFEPVLNSDLELSSIICGKEFGLVRSTNGKVFYYGKSAALGLKSMGKNPTLKLTELVISKVSTIVQMSVGHDGLHALLVANDGSVYFTGTARRSEDGDMMKNRRQPKAVKPKKISKIEHNEVVYTSCNNGTSAFVTKTGKLIIYGKDTSYCDLSGIVTDLSDQHITKVALGKAHCVALNSKGHIFTFGLNNKGQCGRAFQRDRDTSGNQLMESSSECRALEGRNLSSGLCQPDDHFVVFGQCRICTVCKECTGYNIACVCSGSVPVEERVPGTNCPCGHGCSGCCKCGACATCINYQENENLVDVNNKEDMNSLHRQKTNRSKKRDAIDGGSDVERDQPRVVPFPPQRLMLPTNSPVVQIACGLHHTVVLTLAAEVFTFGSNQYGQLGTGDLQPPPTGVAQVKKIHGVIVQVAAGANHTILLNHKGVVYTFGNYQKGQLGRLPPSDGFGSVLGNNFRNVDDGENPNSCSNVNKGEPAAVGKRTPEGILHQRQKFLWNCVPGIVTGVGQSVGKKATWVGGSGDQTFMKIDESLVTPAMLNKVNVVADRNTIVLIPSTPLSFECLTINRRDGSCNAHTYNQIAFAKHKVFGSNAAEDVEASAESDKLNKNVEEDVQPENANIAMPDNRKKKATPVPSQHAFALESTYGNLWMFNKTTRSFHHFNVIACEMWNSSDKSDHIRAILTPELALPLKADSRVMRYQASMNLLACLDILTSASDSIPHCFEAAVVLPPNLLKETQPGDYQSLCRFENLGGGWGYSGHSVEALRFMCDTDIVIGGFGVYGGRGEYSCKLKLYDLGVDGGGYEKEGALIAETEEIPYECPARSKFNVMLPKAVNAASGRWFLVWAKISGPSSDCGAGGQGTVSGDDQVVFTFKSSKRANNGTDVNSGQIPTVLYKVVANREHNKPSQNNDSDAIHKISKLFANTVTKECFDSLITLCRWAWESFKATSQKYNGKNQSDNAETKATLERYLYVNRASLRLLRKYINEVYPMMSSTKPGTANGKSTNDPSVAEIRPKSSKSGAYTLSTMESIHSSSLGKRPNTENILLAECVGEVRALLIRILSDRLHFEEHGQEINRMGLEILEECHRTFVSCFNAFFPTSTLKWNMLCDLLKQSDVGQLHASLLSAVVAGLCSPNVNLRKTFSLLSAHRENRSIVSPSDNSGLPMLSSVENHMFPVLVEQMIYRTQLEKPDFYTNMWTFKEVLSKLLKIMCVPILQKVENLKSATDKYTPIEYDYSMNSGLIDNCCHLLRRVLGEIVYQSCLTEVDVMTPPVRSIQSTGSRYSRLDNSKTWNTGNFGPDAISFSVDKPGIAIAGAMVYSGSGSYDYQLELLQDTMDSKLTSQNRWDVIDTITGTYGQDQVQNDMVEIRFTRPVTIKEHSRYAIRLCSQGAKTCFGDAGVSSLRGPCGVSFAFYPCDLSFNGTTPNRGQLPCILYFSSPRRKDGQSGKIINEIHARDIALQIAREITKQSMEILTHVREIIEMGYYSDKSCNSINAHLVDSEHNITPIEEHLDVSCLNRSGLVAESSSMSLATRELTKKFESFTKGIVESLKSKTNPFECDIEIGSTDIAIQENVPEEGNRNEARNVYDEHACGKYLNFYRQQPDSEDDDGEDGIGNDEDGDSSNMNTAQLLEIFGNRESAMFHTLLPAVLALIGPLVNSDPKSTVQILSLIRQILPHVASLNQQQILNGIAASDSMSPNGGADQIGEEDLLNENQPDVEKVIRPSGDKGAKYSGSTTSNHYCVVESEHPYKSATILTCRVEFPPCVQWFTIEFDSQCGTIQTEDYLNVSIPMQSLYGPTNRFKSNEIKCELDSNNRYVDSVTSMCSLADENAEIVANQCKDDSPDDWFVVKKFNSPGNWDEKSLILPGHRVEFSLQTASNYLNDRHTNKFGFKCLVIGYDNPCVGKFHNSCLIRLEHELSYLGGMCCANLLKTDLILSDDVCDTAQDEDQVFGPHVSLLTKGFTLSESVLTIEQALDSHLPIGSHSNERQFLKDFVCCAPGSSGARLAAWLQPESRLDINKCELKLADDPVHCGWPTLMTITVRDQYGDVVIVPDIKVEMNASPSDTTTNGNRKSKRLSVIEGTGPVPKIPYEATVKDKMCYKAITFMKAYEDFSFEELRFVDPAQSRTSESIAAQDNGNGTFTINWTPTTAGLFCLTVVIDGFVMEAVHRVNVKETGVPPPPQKNVEKNGCTPNKLRKFVAKYSAGLRIRTHPTLQSSQVGVIKMNGVISFIDEVQNDDGIWVRLSTESIRQHVVTTWFPTEAWCLQFNSHLNRTLLFPVNETELDNEDEGPDVPRYPEPDRDGNASGRSQESNEDGGRPSVNRNVLSEDGGASQNNSNPFLNMHESNEETDDRSSVTTEDSRSKSTDAPQSNLGNTIAVVVEEGANKIQALHKWLKGDSMDLKAGIRRRRLGSSGCIDGEGRGSEDTQEGTSSGQQSPLHLQRFDYNNQGSSAHNNDGKSPKQKRNTFLISSSPMVAESKQSRRTKLSNLSRPIHQLSTDTTSTVGSRNGSFEEPVVGVLKRALPPALAESLRAMFAAFLWHEGIVHDAMACASFLKFHPLLPKNLGHISEGSVPEDSLDTRVILTKEEKAQQRHSVEVANAEAYNGQYGSMLDSLAKSGFSSIYNRRRGLQERQKLQALPEVVTVLPPALRCLVFLWEKLCSKSVEMVQSLEPEPERELVPLRPPRNKNEHIFEDATKAAKPEQKRTPAKKEADKSNYCELCDLMLPIPVTYHMRSVHPGCGKSSKGKGYNSVGTYCNGWAGNCGEGGKGATSWYLLCEQCRANYMAQHKKLLNSGSQSDNYGLKALTRINMDAYKNIKENALFLLELSNMEPEHQQLHTVRAQSKIRESHSEGFNANYSGSSANNGNTPKKSVKVRPRKSYATSAEDQSNSGIYWPLPEVFNCMQSLVSSARPDDLHEAADQSGASKLVQRPFSNISFDGNPLENNASEVSKFHRSFSMGHGWQNHFNNNVLRNVDSEVRGNISNIGPTDTVVKRRKNRSSCEEDIGSLLLCNPSVNLRSLVPKEVLDMTTNRVDDNKEIESIILSEVSLISRPTMAFIFDRHDVTKLRSIMRRSLRLAVCRTYALQAMNWLIRSVTQHVGLHDLMWWFVAALNDPELQRADDKDSVEREQAMDHPITGTKLSGHMSLVVSRSLHAFLQTVADLTLLLPAGSPVQQIAVQCFGMRFRQSDHQFLHRSHVFGNISKILSRSDEQNDDLKFSTNGPILEGAPAEQQLEKFNGVEVEELMDLQGLFEVTVSSRAAMAPALVDNSTETFWESDEEDRNKSKFIEVSMLRLNCFCKTISIHVDNSRDITSKVQTIIFYSGQSLGDMNLVKSVDVDDTQKAGCWITTLVKDETATHFRIVLNGEDPTLRVRNIKLMGHLLHDSNERRAVTRPASFALIQQKNCEAATLKVFRLLTGQVFGKLILGRRDTVSPLEKQEEQAQQMGSNENSLLADSLDMREHMVGILFSRSKLTHLQKQVIVHIVYAIKKEARRAKLDWELQTIDTDHKSEATSDASRSTDTYCFEMLSMVLALSGSSVGRSYLSQQYGLLKDLLTMLHVGSDRVQRQVTSLLRRMLPEISPDNLAQLMRVTRKPPLDFSIVYHSDAEDFDMGAEGIIDIFLAVIAKSLQLQIKVKSTATAAAAGGAPNKHMTTVKMGQCLDFGNVFDGRKMEDELAELDFSEADVMGEQNADEFALNRKAGDRNGSRWFLRGVISSKQAENMITLLRDLSMGKLAADTWAPMMKAAVAEAIINLTRLKPDLRTPEECIKTPTLWLALASLCVLDKEHVEKLSSSQWSKLDSRPQCANHDDGLTTAMIQCTECSYLCSECDRVLHLNRQKRCHVRTVCKEEEESIRVELRESCGRTKLFWLLALADWRTLKAMVEFRDGKNSIINEPSTFVGRCRFCGVSGTTGLLSVGNVCTEPQCQENSALACARVRPCGHLCGGVVNEQKCLPCLQYMCHDRENENAELMRAPKLTQDADDMCMICFTDALSCAPSLQLDCGHVFHYHCLKLVLEKRWTGPRITFSFCQCPICKAAIAHELLVDLLEPIVGLKNDVKRKAVMRLEYEGLLKTNDVTDMISFAMDRYAYYVCFKCQKAYYGGEVRCDAEIGEKFDPEELVCGGCSDVARAQMCPKHGTDFLEYKCRYCCSVAVFFCFGTTHFCDTCHDDFQRLTNIPKSKLPKCPAGPKAKQLYGDDCPLHVVHPATGEEFALGCGICRNAQTF